MIFRCIAILLTRSVFIFLTGILLFFIGVPVVALALPFRKSHTETLKQFTQYPGEWVMISLPAWSKCWSNPIDGVCDPRGWWDNYCKTNYGKPYTAFYSMWQWLAIRNSANYWSRVVSGVDASRCKVALIANGKHWQFLCATRDDGKLFPLFEGFIPYNNSNHGLEWRFGWKVELGEIVSPYLPLAERSRGSVFRFRPWKSV